jgi:hypothetical protein
MMNFQPVFKDGSPSYRPQRLAVAARCWLGVINFTVWENWFFPG